MNKEELEKIKQKALEEHIPIIMDDTLEVVDKILTEIKPKRILEIGTAVGYSAICFSEYLQPGGKIDTIERDEERTAEARENIKKVEVEDKINIHFGDAIEILPTLNEKYDVVFIDAAKGKYPFFLKEALRMINDCIEAPEFREQIDKFVKLRNQIVRQKSIQTARRLLRTQPDIKPEQVAAICGLKVVDVYSIKNGKVPEITHIEEKDIDL